MKPCDHRIKNDKCRICYLYDNDPAYRRLWDSEPGKAKSREKPCIYLGQMRTPRTASCWKLCDHDCDFGHQTAKPGANCQACPDYADEDDEAKRLLVSGLPDPMQTEEGEKKDHAAEHLDAFRWILTANIGKPYCPTEAGVVICGGGKYWPGIVVAIRMLRETGSQLPVQVWYRGEFEQVNPDDVQGMGVDLIDAQAMAKRRNDARILRGWEIKHYAITRCNFETVVYLDADAYPIKNPAPLVEMAKDKGFLFWYDLPNCENNIRWGDVWPEGKNGVPTIQGGQLIIHRPSVWREIVLSHWMNQHSDFYYQRMFGDQDTWRVAFAATGGKYHCLGDAGWRETAFVCAHEGQEYFVHRCQGKLFRQCDIPHGNTSYSSPKYNLPEESRVFTHLGEVLASERDAERVFNDIYARNLWGGGSGTGSGPIEAAPYASAINSLRIVSGWRSVTDAGCGDGRVSDMLDFEQYTGVDVGRSVIDQNRMLRPQKSWILADFYRNPESLPAADVLLAKDVLHHWPTAWITDWLTRIAAMKRWKAIILTQDVNQQAEGQDCHLGGYRALHPSMMPLKQFNLKTICTYLHKAILLMEISP